MYGLRNRIRAVLEDVMPLVPALTNLLTGHIDSVVSVAWSTDGRRIASGDRDGSVRLWSTSSGKQLYELLHYPSRGRIRCVAFSPYNHLAAYILSKHSHDPNCRSIVVWESLTGNPTGLLGRDGDRHTSITFHPRLLTLLSGSWNENLTLWDLDSGDQVDVM